MSAPDYVEPIVGLRSWRLRDRILRPVNRLNRFSRYQGEPMTDHFRETMLALEQWSPLRAQRAVCAAQDVYERFDPMVPPWSEGTRYVGARGKVVDCQSNHHPGFDSPVQDCSCGHYATSRADKVPMRFSRDDEGDGIYVVGQVIMWGRLIEHEEGWRAQYAYPGRVYVGRMVESYLNIVSYGRDRSRFMDDDWYGRRPYQDQIDRAAHDLSRTYGIRALPLSFNGSLPWGELIERGMLAGNGVLLDKAVPTESQQLVRPWAYEPDQVLCSGCGQGFDGDDPTGYRHRCPRLEIDPWYAFEMRRPFDSPDATFEILKDLWD